MLLSRRFVNMVSSYYVQDMFCGLEDHLVYIPDDLVYIPDNDQLISSLIKAGRERGAKLELIQEPSLPGEKGYGLLLALEDGTLVEYIGPGFAELCLQALMRLKLSLVWDDTLREWVKWDDIVCGPINHYKDAIVEFYDRDDASQTLLTIHFSTQEAAYAWATCPDTRERYEVVALRFAN